MRVLIAGSDRSISEHSNDQRRFQETAFETGKRLAQGRHTLIVESDCPKTFDYHAIQGAISARKSIGKTSILVHRIEDHRLIFQNQDALDVKHTLHRRPGDHEADIRARARLSAVNSCDAAILMGGKTGTATFLRLCSDLRRPFVPITRFGGPCLDGSARVPSHPAIADRVHDLESLVSCSDDPPAIAGAAVDLTLLVAGHQGFFLSYSHCNQEIADHIEVLLKRSGERVFRDESQLRIGVPLEGLKAGIESCDTFLGLWTKEYEASDWCQTELQWASEGHESSETPKRVFLMMCDESELRKDLPRFRQPRGVSRSEREKSIQDILSQWPLDLVDDDTRAS